MGPVIGLDTQIFIYVFEQNPKYHNFCLSILKKIQRGEVQGVFSSIGLIELLTGPYSNQRLELARTYSQYLDQLKNFAIVYDNPSIVRKSVELRAKYNLATPDAIHLATAIFLEADYFLTNDKKLKKVKEIKVKLLTE